jgi:hypothetical protein
VFEKPSAETVHTWQLACVTNIAHVVVMPSSSREKLDRFFAVCGPSACPWPTPLTLYCLVCVFFFVVVVVVVVCAGLCGGHEGQATRLRQAGDWRVLPLPQLQAAGGLKEPLLFFFFFYLNQLPTLQFPLCFFL